jgi:tetratricopeptide (TPR) repeat protein
MKKKILIFFTVFFITFPFYANAGGSSDGGSGERVSLQEAIAQSAGMIASELPPGSRVAIMSFFTQSARLSDFIMEELTSELIKRRIEVADRQNLEYVQRELNFQMSDAVNEDSAQSIGKFLGAVWVITGQLMHTGSEYRFSVNVIRVETATRVSVPRFNVADDQNLRRLIASLDRQTAVVQTANNNAAAQTAGAFLDRGILFASRGEFQIAIEDFSEAIRLNPNLVGAYIMRGRAYVATAATGVVVESNFSGITTSSTYGNISAEQARIYDLAIADFTSAIRLDPNNSTAYRERGRAYDNKGDGDRAMADYNQALRLNPNDPRAYNNRGVVYHARNDYDRAIADYTQAIRIDPNFAGAYNNRGDVYHERNDYDRAIADYTQAIRIDPNFAYAYRNRGDVYHERNDYDRAIADYTQAIRIDPNYKWPYYNRGIIYVDVRKNYDLGIADYNQAIRIDPNFADAYYSRAVAYWNKGDFNRVIADFEAVLRINPNHADARHWLEEARRRGR